MSTAHVEEPEKTGQMTAMELLNAYKATPDGCHLVPETTRQTIHSLTIVVEVYQVFYGEIFSHIDWNVNRSAIGFYSPSMRLMKAEDGSSPLFPAIRHCTKWNTLYFEDLTQPTVQAIIGAFPAVTELNFLCSVVSNGGEMESLTALLSSTGWGRQLTSFTLTIPINTKYRGTGALFEAINALSALTYLKIDLGEEGLELHELTVLDQLQKFSLSCLSVHWPFFLSQLYSTRNDLLQIELCSEERNIQTLSVFRQHLRERIVRLSDCALCFSQDCNLSDVCSKFPSLISLALELPFVNAESIFSKLATLRHLVHLKLSIKFGVSTPDNHHFHPLLSVKGFELIFSCDSHDQLEWLDLPRTMPHLQAIGLSYFTCRGCNVTNCGFRAEDLTPEKLASVRRCISAMLRILLRTGVPVGAISFRGEEHLGSAEQLLRSDD